MLQGYTIKNTKITLTDSYELTVSYTNRNIIQGSTLTHKTEALTSCKH